MAVQALHQVVRLLDHLKIKKAHVVGSSMGAWVAGTLLVTHPDRLLSVTLIGGGPWFEPSKEFVASTDALIKGLEQSRIQSNARPRRNTRDSESLGCAARLRALSYSQEEVRPPSRSPE